MERAQHPVDVVEQIAAMNDWSFDRDDQDEISISVAGVWANYNVAFTWLGDVEALHVACAFDLKVPKARATEMLTLVAMINEQMWVGHFDHWPRENVVMFRHALLLAGGAENDGRQCEAILASAIQACERYYQAFQFVVWGGKTAREALDAVMFESKGNA